MRENVVDDRYVLGELLGKGGMAKVYLARDEVSDRDVALKVLRDRYAEDEKFVERFRREARSVTRFSHPNIVPIHDWGCSGGGVYYIAMEYVPGGTLKDCLKRKGILSPATAIGVTLQIAEALRAAHENGVIHRDVKPQNVLMTRSGNVKVADFGIAKASSSPSTTTGAILGTAAYISPERALGKPAGPRSDLYSLGVVLYEMLTGKLPYDAETDTAVAVKHVTEPVRSPRKANPSVPEALDALTAKLLAKNPEDRYPSASALVDDLERARSGLFPAAVRTEPVARMVVYGRIRRRQGKLLSALVALFCGVGLLGGLTAMQGDTGVPQPEGSGDVAQSSAQATPEEVPVKEQKGKSKEEEKQKGKGKEKGKEK